MIFVWCDEHEDVCEAFWALVAEAEREALADLDDHAAALTRFDLEREGAPYLATLFGTDPLHSGESDDEPYDDSRDHERCPDCPGTPGWYTPLVGPRQLCDTCGGAGWL